MYDHCYGADIKKCPTWRVLRFPQKLFNVSFNLSNFVDEIYAALTNFDGLCSDDTTEWTAARARGLRPGDDKTLAYIE